MIVVETLSIEDSISSSCTNLYWLDTIAMNFLFKYWVISCSGLHVDLFVGSHRENSMTRDLALSEL